MMPHKVVNNTIPSLAKSEEIALAAARGLISELPGGGLLLELIPVVAPERIKRFFRATEDDLVKLVAAGRVNPEDLTHNENFFSVLLAAANIAVRNHQEEKLEMLRNAVLNAALPDAPDDDIQAMYLGYIDRLTPWHVKILRFLDTPHEPEISTHNLAAIFEEKFPELSGKRDFYLPIMQELYFLTLIVGHLSSITFSHEDTFVSEVESGVASTRLGREFLKYLGSPLA